jgi:hypothetical protein
MKGHRGSSDIDIGKLLNAVRTGNRTQFSSLTAGAWGETPKPQSKLIVKVSSTSELGLRRKRGTFLTGNEVEEVPEEVPDLPVVEEKEPSLEDMVRDLDDFQRGIAGDFDDLAEVRRRITACRKGIDEQRVHTDKLRSNIIELDNRNKDFLEGRELRRSKSYGRLQDRSGARRAAAKAVLSRW